MSGKDGTGATTGDYVLTVRRLGNSAPTAELTSAPDVASSPGATYEFIVRYHDDGALDVGSFDNTEAAVRAPDGSTLPVVQSALVVNDAGVATLTYRLDAPGGTFDPTDSGTYVIELRGGVTKDTSGNAASAQELGEFQVSLAAAPTLPPLRVTVFDSTTGLAEGSNPAVTGTRPIQADLAVRNELQALWLGVTVTHSAGGAVVAGGGPLVAQVLTPFGLVNPGGDVAYRATFAAAGETVRVSMNVNSPLAVAANLADVILARFGITTPDDIASFATSIQSLPSLQKVVAKLASLPDAPKQRLKVMKAAASSQ